MGWKNDKPLTAEKKARWLKKRKKDSVYWREIPSSKHAGPPSMRVCMFDFCGYSMMATKRWNHPDWRVSYRHGHKKGTLYTFLGRYAEMDIMKSLFDLSQLLSEWESL